MTTIHIDFNKQNGKIKPMNAVNNGPTAPGVRNSYSNFYTYKEARIPYARNHDASFFSGYGGEHTVDVHRIFKNFDADVNDPASYIFEPTDQYVKTTFDAGTKVFYRLGASIEHGYKYGTRVPKDYLKWAQICEHIIRHYTEGWDNGFQYDMEYWEIWNEPECHNADGSNPCWQGTDQEFIDFFAVAVKYLKECFPDKKIGGPALASIWSPIREDVLDRVAADKLPIDFLSYHWYGCDLKNLVETIKFGKEALAKRGLDHVETILNEWNYIKGWQGDTWKYSLQTERSLKGASFITGAMCIGQGLPLDMLMYYDARPCGMNGMFEHETYRCLKGYYSISAFSDLAALGTYVDCGYSNDHVYYTAATDNAESALLYTYFDDEEKESEKAVSFDINALSDNTTAEIYVIDANNDLELVSTQDFTTKNFTIKIDTKLFSTVLVKFR